MPRPTRQTDAMTANGWYLELPGVIAPHFETLDGLKAGSVESFTIVDGGSNKKVYFSGQAVDFGEFTLTRTRQGTADDKTIFNLVEACMKQGLKFNARVVKLHHGVEAFSIFLENFRFTSKNYPTLDVNSSDKFLESYGATADDVIEL
jgi:hypothetical protein